MCQGLSPLPGWAGVGAPEILGMVFISRMGIPVSSVTLSLIAIHPAISPAVSPRGLGTIVNFIQMLSCAFLAS